MWRPRPPGATASTAPGMPAEAAETFASQLQPLEPAAFGL